MRTEFQVGDHRFIPSRPVRFNGTPGHFWERRQLIRGCWVFMGRKFHPTRATHQDIAHLPIVELRQS